jgi:hypothetical protein
VPSRATAVVGERTAGTGTAAGIGDVEPGDRLAVELTAGDGPVEQDLQAAGQAAGVPGSAEEHRVGRRDVVEQFADRRRHWLLLPDGHG